MEVKGKVFTRSTLSGNIHPQKPVEGILEIPRRVYVRELYFSTHYEFPSIGDEGMLYIATDENAQYRYDNTDHAYHCVGRNPEDIDTIQIRLREDI